MLFLCLKILMNSLPYSPFGSSVPASGERSARYQAVQRTDLSGRTAAAMVPGLTNCSTGLAILQIITVARWPKYWLNKSRGPKKLSMAGKYWRPKLAKVAENRLENFYNNIDEKLYNYL
jgi:hypothetical protein